MSEDIEDLIMNHHHLKILKELANDSTLSQRDLAKRLGISLGKTNYLLHALMDKGHVKARNFKISKNKLKYIYVVTPSGIRAKTDLALAFLKSRIDEYDAIAKEIEELKGDLGTVDMEAEAD